MSEIMGLKTNTTKTAAGNAKGVAAQMIGAKPPGEPTAPLVDPYGNEMPSQQQEPGYFSNGLFTYLQNAPTMAPAMGFTNYRGQQTILKGGFKEGSSNWFQNNLNPRGLKGRFSSVDAFAPEVENAPGIIKRTKSVLNGGEELKGITGRHSAGYSPFNAADLVNKSVRGIEKRGAKVRASVMKDTVEEAIKSGKSSGSGFGMATRAEGIEAGKAATPISSWLRDKGIIQGKEGSADSVVGRGFVSHMSAAQKVGGIKGPIGETVAENMNNTWRVATGKALPAGVEGPAIAGPMSAEMTGAEASSKYMGTAIEGTLGSRMAGFTAGAQYGAAGVADATTATGKAAAERAVSNLAGAGLERSAAGELLMGGEKIGMRGIAKTLLAKGAEEGGLKVAAKAGATLAAGGAASWIPVVNVAMAAWMVYDLAKLGTEMAKEMVIKPAINFTKDAFTSFKGQIDKAPMGMGFKDNSVAMTARQRGVMAISNSRLNARSVLGSEAAGLAAHFG